MGWLLGAGIGWMLGGPLGAVMGGAMQHAMSGPARLRLTHTSQAATGEQVFVSHLVVIATKICMADGAISGAERKAIHNFFAKSLGYHGPELRFIDALIDETQRVNPDLHQICLEFDRHARREQRLLLLDLAYQIATTDHVVTKGEREAIEQLVAALGIRQDEHERIRARYALVKRADHYHTLGLSASASRDEIKKVYRQLAMQYHPDKVSHLGPELIAFAEKKFKDIQEAYSAVQKERGF